MDGYILSLPQITQQHILQFFFVRGNCLPCCGFVGAEVRDNGGKCGHELIGSGRKTELCFEVGTGVEVVA